MSSPVLQPVAPSTAARLTSLDAFRGFTMFWLMGGKPFFVALAALGGPFAAWISYELNHSAWEGLRYYDLIWPCFMLMVGVSVPFSFARRRAGQTRGQLMRQAWRRATVLFLLGSLRESMSANAPMWIELSSALQPIAVAYLAACYLAEIGVRLQIAVAAGLLVLYALMLAFVPAPGIPAGTYEVNRNIVTAVDQMVLGRAHPEGWGTVLTTIPTISTTILGLLFGQVLLSSRPDREKMRIFGATGICCVLAGFLLSPFIPVIMKLWTTSYGLVSAGWASLLFLLFYWVIDVRARSGWAFPLVVIGSNALAAYLGPSIVPVRRICGIFTKPVANAMGEFGALFSTAVVLLSTWLILNWMFKKKIFLRA